MSLTTTPEFLTLALNSKVLDESQFRESFPDDGELPGDARECATVLVRAKLLTAYQAAQLIAGRHRGFILGPYRILHPVGQGGMGRVFLAEHMQLRRKVALKVMHGGKAENGLSVERFFREARAAAALDHPNIVRIHDVCQQSQVRYLVMEYVEGDTLEALVLKGGAMGVSRAVDYIAQAAAGLQHAHEKGLIHRDIKPANLMLARDGVVKILDMGLARSIDDAADRLTQRMEEGVVVGTVDYISPEQSMNAPQIDIRGDIYSLGATFYTLVTGKPLFSGTTAQKLTQHQLKRPPSLTATDRTVPPGLAAVVERMLQKKPEDRYQTPADVIAALAEWLPDAGTVRVVAGLSTSDSTESEKVKRTISELVKGSSTELKPARSGRSTGRKRRQRWAIAGGALAAVAVVGLCVALLSGSKKDPPSVARNDPRRLPHRGLRPRKRPTPPARRPRRRPPRRGPTRWSVTGGSVRRSRRRSATGPGWARPAPSSARSTGTTTPAGAGWSSRATAG